MYVKKGTDHHLAYKQRKGLGLPLHTNICFNKKMKSKSFVIYSCNAIICSLNIKVKSYVLQEDP